MTAEVPPQSSGSVELSGAGIVTGAAGAIGRAVTDLLVAAGASVVAADLRWPEHVAHAESEPHPQVVRRAADVRDIAQLRKLTSECVSHFGRLDYIVANAGVGDGSYLVDGDTDRWRTVIETNVLGLAHSIRAVLPHLRNQGHGHVVIVASVSGRISYVGEPIYAATKWAAVGLGAMLRKEAQAYGVRTTVIEPGLVDTPLSRASDLGRADLERTQPLLPGDVADLILFAMTRPPHVNITEVVIQPTDELY